MKYLITGFPGSGKSTVAIKLHKTGYTAYDTKELTRLLEIRQKVQADFLSSSKIIAIDSARPIDKVIEKISGHTK